MHDVMVACRAWRESPSPERWQAALRATLALLERAGELPPSRLEARRMAYVIMERCGASMSAVFDR